MNAEEFPQIIVQKKTGAEQFHTNGLPSGHTLLDFWQWYASDLVSNAMRGMLAEYIVASALGLTEGTRIEWDAYDLVTSAGAKIEVKSAAYLQSWYHKKLSLIQFSIRPTRYWDATNNTLAQEARRQCDIYVFCLLHHTDKATVDPMDLDQWTFYVLLADKLNRASPTQGKIGLSSLLRLGPHVVGYSQLKDCVESMSRGD